MGKSIGAKMIKPLKILKALLLAILLFSAFIGTLVAAAKFPLVSLAILCLLALVGLTFLFYDVIK